MQNLLTRLQSMLDSIPCQIGHETSISGIVIPIADPFQSNFVDERDNLVQFLTGFSGSAGIFILLKGKGYLFTDGRYTLQAKQEVDLTQVEVLPHTSFSSWLSEKKDIALAYDPWLHSESQMSHWQSLNSTIVWIPLKENPICQLWQTRPLLNNHQPGQDHPLEFSGESSKDKVEKLIQRLKENNLEGYLITSPTDLCWLLNVRGYDLPTIPIIKAYAVVFMDGSILVSCEPTRKIPARDKMEVIERDPFIERLSNLDCSIGFMPSQTPKALYGMLKKPSPMENPCVLWKAIKNKVEQDGMRACHVRDGLAVTRFLHWLSTQKTTTELDVCKKLKELRSRIDNFHGLSFDTIAGFKENGAIIHYHPSKKTNKKIEGNGLLLVDSGGQYLDGTTDITRTIAIGPPTSEEKKFYTLVLKGHIALASARFPMHTTGTHLDVLARGPLWQEGCDFNHGTGHGVGSFLSVHEGPIGISRIYNPHPLVPGMILSNEPGYYKEGAFGIRIESLVLVKESKYTNYFEFETLTLVPFDLQLIEVSMVTVAEKEWINAYHQRVYKAHAPYFEDLEWLKFITKKI